MLSSSSRKRKHSNPRTSNKALIENARKRIAGNQLKLSVLTATREELEKIHAALIKETHDAENNGKGLPAVKKRITSVNVMLEIMQNKPESVAEHIQELEMNITKDNQHLQNIWESELLGSFHIMTEPVVNTECNRIDIDIDEAIVEVLSGL